MDNRKSNRLRRWAREGVILVLLTLAVAWGVDQYRKPSLPASFSATPMTSIDGKMHDIAALSQERPLLIYVWATWCGVCRYTTPSVASLAADGGNVLTVALRSGDNVTLEKWLTRKKMTLPTVNDPSGQLARQWDIRVTPTLVVISQGEVKSVTTGWTSSWGMRLRLWLASW